MDDTYVKSNYDLVLIQAPGWGTKTPPLGLAMLTAFMRNHNYRVLTLDLNIECYMNRGDKYKNIWELEQSQGFWGSPIRVDEFIKDNKNIFDTFIQKVLQIKPKLFGFSIYNSSLYVSMYIAKQIKENNSNIKIIYGGPQVSRFMLGKSIVKDPNVDILAQGEGELVLLDVMRRLYDGKDIYSCPGTLAYKEGIVIDNGDAPLISKLDDLPFADLSDYDFNNYQEPFKLPMMSSRGCVNRCIFCNERPYWRTYRNLKADRIYAEVKYQLEKYPFVDWIDFQDSVVNGNVKELERFADLIIKSGIKIRWAGQAVIRKEMTLDLHKKLKNSGCICLGYGLETLSSSLMLKVGKVVSRDADVNKIIKEAAEAGITCAYNFMFGLPGETEDDFNNTLKYLKNNKQYFATVNPSAGFCLFSPGTLGYENPHDYGLGFSKGAEYWESDNGKNNYLLRLRRFEEFCRLVQALGIPTTYPADRLLERELAIGNYYHAAREYNKAASAFNNWLKNNSYDKVAENKLNECLSKMTKYQRLVQKIKSYY